MVRRPSMGGMAGLSGDVRGDIGIHKSFDTTTEEDFDALMAVHVKGVFFLTQRLLPMIEDGGRILNVSSGLARFALPGYAAYGSMKGAIEVLTRYLAKELGPRRIAVNVVAPGAIETDFSGGAVRDNPELNRIIASTTAMGRVDLPDDIGGAVASILASKSRWTRPSASRSPAARTSRPSLRRRRTAASQF